MIELGLYGHLYNPESSSSWITPKIFIFKTLVEHIGYTCDISTVYLYQLVIVECTIGCDIIDYYVYPEGGFKKLGNNVVSCIFDNFKGVGYFSSPCMANLAICEETFWGHNKHHIVIWFIIWLIENGIFPKVTLIFCVWVHTQNLQTKYPMYWSESTTTYIYI